MKRSSFLTINAIVVFVFGLGFVLMPETLMSLYGVTLSTAGVAIGRLLGAAFVGFGYLRWTARNSKWSDLLGAIVMSAIIEDSIGFIVVLKAQMAGVMNASGWSVVVLYGLFALGFGYFYFQKKS
jgi:hypothetical protein